MDITNSFLNYWFEQAFRATSALFDGEIVCLGGWKPNLKRSIECSKKRKARLSGPRQASRGVLYFDCLYLDGRVIVMSRLSGDASGSGCD